MRKKGLAVLAVAGSLAFGVAACGDDDDDSAASGSTTTEESSRRRRGQRQDRDRRLVDRGAVRRGRGRAVQRGEPRRADHGRHLRHRRRLREVLRRRDRHLHRVASDRRGGGGARLREGRRQVHRDRVANDGIAVATNKDLTVDCMTTEQLKKLWNKGSKVKNLSEIDRSFPDTELSLYGPGTDSGTFDFFTDEINGEEGVSREDYEASEDDNQLVTGVVRRRGRLRLLRLLLLRGRGGLAEPGRRGQRRRQLRQAVRRDDPGRLLHAALPPAVHVPEGRRRCAAPEVKAFLDFTVETRGRSPRRRRSSRSPRSRSAPPRKSSRPPRAARRGTTAWLIHRSRSDGAMGRRTSLVRRPSRRSRFEAGVKALLFVAAAVSVATTLAIIFSLVKETIAFFGDVAVGDYLFGTKWTPQFAGDQQSFGVIPLVWGTFYLTFIGLVVAVPVGVLVGDLPRRVRAARHPQDRQAGARAARRRPDDRLRLLRPHVLHARGAPRRSRASASTSSTPCRRASSSASSWCRRSRRSSRTRCRPSRSRCARAPPASAPTRCRPRSASSSPPRSRASSRRWCSAPRARSARR